MMRCIHRHNKMKSARGVANMCGRCSKKSAFDMIGILKKFVAKYFSPVTWTWATVPSILDASSLIAISKVGCLRDS